MKKFIKKISLLALIASVGLVSCEEEGSSKKSSRLTDKEIAQIESDMKIISRSASEIVANTTIDPAQVMTLLEEYKQLETVEDAWLDIDGIVVKVKKGGLVMWSYPQEFIAPPFFDLDKMTASASLHSAGLRASTANKILPENNKVGIYCALENRDFENDARQVLYKIENLLDDNGFEADPIFDDDFTMNSLMTEFPKYGAIIVLSHGNLVNVGSETLMLFQAGEKFEYDWLGQIKGEYKELYKYWKDNRIIISMGTSSPKICVTQKFFESNFADGSLPNTLAFFMPCRAMENGMSIGKIMERKRKGKGVTLGYNESNSIAPYTGLYLFSALLNGVTVGESFEDFIPYECLHNAIGDGITAELVYYPSEGKNVALIGKSPEGSIEFISPQNGTVYSSNNDRVQTLKGICHGFGSNITGTVSVNSVNYTLNFINDSEFEQLIEINQGSNVIKVTCMSNQSKPVTASSEITVTGNFPRMPLYTAMRWDTNNTDVDLHLVGPNNEDCYYAHKTASWGGFLDIDNTWGRGPEHITIPELKMTGTYRLFVHYFAERGHGTSHVWVNVSTTSNEKQFDSYPLNATGDIWEVCTIEFPSGAITTTNLRNSSSFDESVRQLFLNLPQKK